MPLELEPMLLAKVTSLPLVSKVEVNVFAITSLLETSWVLVPFHCSVALPAKVMLPVEPKLPLANDSVPRVKLVPPV